MFQSDGTVNRKQRRYLHVPSFRKTFCKTKICEYERQKYCHFKFKNNIQLKQDEGNEIMLKIQQFIQDC